MPAGQPTVLVTGVAGNLGLRLLEQLAGFSVAGVDVIEPARDFPIRFQPVDLGEEASCRQIVDLLRETRATAVVHLAFVLDPVRAGVLDPERMWRINVAGTARVMEAIAVVNRGGGAVEKFIFPSSISVYGPGLRVPASEDSPLGARSLVYALHKKEADEVVRLRATSLGQCSTYVLRPAIYVGATMQNYMVNVLRGAALGRGRLANWLRRKGARLPLLLPFGRQYLGRRFQFVHVDDVARLIRFILLKPERVAQLTVMNVAGHGAPLALGECARIAGAKITRLPGQALCQLVLRLLWSLEISAVPPEAFPYMIGEYLMDTSRLQAFLGSEYEQVIRYTCEEALEDSFHASSADTQIRTAALA